MKKGTAPIFNLSQGKKNRRCPLFLCFILFIFCAFVTPAGSQEMKKDETTPKGMEIRDVGSARVIVPKDMKLTEGKGVIIREDLTEYLARVISDIKEDIAKIKFDQDELKKEVGEIKKYLEDRSRNTSAQKQKTNEGG